MELFKLSVLKTLVILGAFSAGAVASAADTGECTEIDVRADLGAPRDQAGTSWCFANTTADLISQAVGHRVSAFDIATQFFLADTKEITAHPDPQIQAFLRKSPETIDRIDESRADGRTSYTTKRILTKRGLFAMGGVEDGALLMSNVRGFCEDEALSDGAKNYIDYLVKIEKYRKVMLEKSCVNPSMKEPIGKIRDQNTRVAAHVLLSWINQRCQTRIQSARPIVPRILYFGEDTGDYADRIRAKEITRAGSRKKLFAEVDFALEHGKAAAISYSAYDLIPKRPGDEQHAEHSSIIAARKTINGTCHYFVRNSWGQECGYKNEFKANCEKSQGGVWVPPSALKTLFGVTSIE